jgi:hypothetical protein
MPKRDPAFSFVAQEDEYGNPYTMIFTNGRFVVDDIPCQWIAGNVRQNMLKLKEDELDGGAKMMWSPHEMCEKHWVRYGALVYQKNCNGSCEGRFDPYAEAFS